MPVSAARPLIFAGLGDAHGHLDEAAELVRRVRAEAGVDIAFALQVGDLEAHRDAADLATMYAPFRQKRIGDFPAYRSGARRFPCPMYFIGGNHESYGFLDEGPLGLTVAPDVHYLGRAGTTTIQGLKVAYLTGCYDETVLRDGRDGTASAAAAQDSAAHRANACFTSQEVSELLAVSRPHVLLVHEWPLGLVRREDHETGEPRHRHLRYGETGVPLVRHIIERMGPQLVLCGHLHRRYSGTVPNVFGDRTTVHCLGRVDSHDEGLALFTWDGSRVRERPL